MKFDLKPVRRCTCGRTISNNRLRCLACQEALLQDLASQIDSQELLDAVLDRNFPNTRQETLARLAPHLKFLQTAEAAA